MEGRGPADCAPPEQQTPQEAVLSSARARLNAAWRQRQRASAPASAQRQPVSVSLAAAATLQPLKQARCHPQQHHSPCGWFPMQGICRACRLRKLHCPAEAARVRSIGEKKLGVRRCGCDAVPSARGPAMHRNSSRHQHVCKAADHSVRWEAALLAAQPALICVTLAPLSHLCTVRFSPVPFKHSHSPRAMQKRQVSHARLPSAIGLRRRKGGAAGGRRRRWVGGGQGLWSASDCVGCL